MAGASFIAAIMVVMVALAPCVTATDYTVGGAKFGWSAASLLGANYGGIPDFFRHWANTNGPFHTTDRLVFTFETEDSLLLVSYADYQTCNTAKPIQFWDGMPGGLPRTVLFPLADHGMSTLYFIGGYKGKCAAGQKVHIDVLD